MDNTVVDIGSNSISRAKSESGRFFVETTFFDDKALAQNQKIRDSGMLDKGKLGLHENEDIRYAISVPSSEQWQLFKAANPDIYKLITSRIEAERMRGAKQLQILHPAWVVYDRA